MKDSITSFKFSISTCFTELRCYSSFIGATVLADRKPGHMPSATTVQVVSEKEKYRMPWQCEIEVTYLLWIDEGNSHETLEARLDAKWVFAM